MTGAFMHGLKTPTWARKKRRPKPFGRHTS
jgi:hypothetical protein